MILKLISERPQLTKVASFAAFGFALISTSLACFGDGEQKTCTSFCTYEVATQREYRNDLTGEVCDWQYGSQFAMDSCMEGCAVEWETYGKQALKTVKGCAQCLDEATAGSIRLDDYERALARCDIECQDGELVNLLAGWGVVWFDELECSG